MRSPLVWAVLLSAVAVSLAQPNDGILIGNPWLGLVGWVPLFWALRRTVSPRSAAGLGALFGLVTTVLQNSGLWFFPGSAMATGGIALGIALYGALLGPLLRTLLQRSDAARPFLVGACWAVFEFLKSNGVFGFPSGLAPYPFHTWLWFIQVVDLVGLSFLSFLIVSWNAWLAEALEPGGYFHRSSAVFFACVVAGMVGYGVYRLNEARPSRGSVQLALVQQNGDPWNAGDDLGPLSTAVKHSREALKETRPDLVVWSEASLRHPLQEWRPYYERNPADAPLFRTIRGSRSWWLFGNPYFQDFSLEKGVHDGVVNAAVLTNPQAQIVDYYGKIQQVPLAEYVPFWNVPAVRGFLRSVGGVSGSWDLGRRWTIFEVPVRGEAKRFRFGTPLGLEDTFPWLNAVLVRNGAEVLISLSNGSGSRESSQWQHHVAALFRAVENRVWLVRSSTSGVTSVIDPTGRVTAGPLPTFQDGHLNVQLPLSSIRTLTPYTQTGDWLVAFFGLLVMGALVSDLRRRS